MASSPEHRDPNQSKCSVCRQFYKDPKLLPCGHLLCHCCVLTWMKSQDQFDCPLCGTSIVDLETRQLKTLAEIAYDLPTDVSMEAMVHADYLLSREHTCRVCDDVAASSMCLNCGDMLCAACKRAHGKLSALKHHRVEDLTQLTKEKVAASSLSTCSNHPDEIAKLFCVTHGLSICFQCVSSQHKNCLEVEDLEEKMEEAQEVLSELADTLTAGESNLQWGINELDDHLQKNQQKMKIAITEIEDMSNKLESSVKENRHRLKEMMVEAFCDVKEAVDENKGYLFQRQDKMTSHKHVIRRVQELKNYENVHVLKPLIETRTQDLDYSVTPPAEAKPICGLHFSINHEAVSRLRKAMQEVTQLQIFPVEIFADQLSAPCSCLFAPCSCLLPPAAVCFASLQLPVLQFHENHGSNVALSEDGMTAEKMEETRSDNAIVLSTESLHFDVLYEVRVDECGNTYLQGSMCVGVVTQNPLSVSLPAWSGHLKSSAIVVRKNWVKNSVTGSQVTSDFGAELGSLQEGSRVGVALDSGRCLHLYVDGVDQGVAARDVPRPCYALFDICDDIHQVTTLPVMRLPKEKGLSGSSQLLAVPGRETSM
ncbi:hypothetical protein ACOMHN_015176 [Nucella lapillus]